MRPAFSYHAFQPFSDEFIKQLGSLSGRSWSWCAFCCSFHLLLLIISSANGNCFNCGQPGHRKIDCPAPIQQQSGGFRSDSLLFSLLFSDCYRRNAQSRRASGGNCFNCGQPGHRKLDCPNLPSGESAGAGSSGGFRSSSGSSGACFNCGETGHRKADCPSLPEGGSGSSRPPITCYK